MVMLNSDLFEDQRVCIIGLGYVGLTLAVSMADAGFQVMGIEIRESVIEALDQGRAPFHEPGLEKQLLKLINLGNFRYSRSIPEDWEGTVYIITVGTPLGENGKYRLDMIKKATFQVRDRIKKNDLVILRSTVKLGTTINIVKPILDNVCSEYDIAFCPERTIEGNALAELNNLPQIVGGLTEYASERASKIFKYLTSAIVTVENIETAEIIKLIDNTYRDVNFAFANEVARICDAIGVSATEVIQAGKNGYSRTNIPLPGLVGGPCLEKDPHILAESVKHYGIEPKIAKAARYTNENQPSEVVSFIKNITSDLIGFSDRPIISLMGIAFKGKPATDDIRGTMAKPIFKYLSESFPKAKFRGYDTVVCSKDIIKFGLESVDSIEEAFVEASLIIIMNNHPVFSNINIENLVLNMRKPSIIYDFWNLYKATDLRLPNGINYISLGNHGLFNSNK